MTVSQIKGGKGWRYSKAVPGREKPLRGESQSWTKKQAEMAEVEAVAKWMANLDHEAKPGSRTFGEAYRVYREDKGAVPKAWRRAEGLALDDFGDTRLRDVRSRAIKRKAKEHHPASVHMQHHYIKLVVATINHVADDEDEDWCDPIKMKLPEKPSSPPKEPVSVEWVTKFCETAVKMGPSYAHYAPMCLMMLLTGARVDELARIETDDIDWELCTTFLWETKTEGKPIPVPAELHAMLKEMDRNFRKMVAMPGEFPGMTSNRRRSLQRNEHLLFRIGHKSAVWKRWEAICDEAGIRHATPHTSRHTFATTLIDLGCSPVDIVATKAWKDVGTLMRVYTHSQMKRGDTSSMIAGRTTKEEMLRETREEGNLLGLINKLSS